MLQAIRDFFEQRIGQPATEDDARRLPLATAALLVEVVRGDGEISPAERAAMLAAVTDKFGLAAADAEQLVRLAEQEAKLANDYYQFTSLINRRFTPGQKVRVIELMWRVAFADAALSAREQHVLRKIADLLHVPHGDYIAAKMRARDGAAG